MFLIKLCLSLLFILYQVQSGSIFCSSLCSNDQCSGGNLNQCTACSNTFMPGNSGGAFSCIAQTVNVTSTNAKYMPIGTSPDINYDLKSNTTISNMTVTSTASPLTGTCSSAYKYYGDLSKTDKITFSHPGISDPNLYFYKIRIRVGVFTKDKWSGSSELKVNFTGNASQPAFITDIDDGSMDMKDKKCGDNNEDDHFKAFDAQFQYNDTNAFDFILSVQNNNQNNPWGISHFVVQARLCHAYCTACWADDNTKCSTCNYVTYLAKLSNTTCALNCTIGYGNDTAMPDTCIQCATNCSSCLDVSTNCTLCLTGFYLYPSGNGTACINPCPSHYFPNNTAPSTCQICDALCLNCSGPATKCTACYPGKYLYSNTCWTTCPNQTYANSTSMKCFNCNNSCYTCTNGSNNCSVCDINGTYKAYLLNTTCLTNCIAGYFNNDNNGTGPNVCSTCDIACATCTMNPTFCQSCKPGYYYLNNTCNITCPQPDYFADYNTWTCLLCSVSCVNMTMNVYFPTNLKQQLYCDMIFMQGLNWSTTDIQSFVSISISDPLLSLSNFDITYQVVDSKTMRVKMVPKGYIFIYNASITFTTRSFNGSYDVAGNGYPFFDSNYAVTKSISWFLIKAPSLSQTQKTIIDSVSTFSQNIIKFTTLPYFQQIKKAGVFALLMGGAQATSTACLINTIPAQNFYEGVRFWAAFVFFDVPQWEQGSDKTKYMVVPSVNQLVKNARLLEKQYNQYGLSHDDNINFEQTQTNKRLLFDTQTVQWRFQRTGHTSFFIYDTYINIILIVLCWILLLIGNLCIKDKVKSKKVVSLFYSFVHKAHQVSIFYISLATLLEWIYFDAGSLQRWISFGVCLLFNVYFLSYELYIYHDMISYPSAQIGNKKYEYFCMRYGGFLKNIRFIQYDKKQKWTVSHWFRPYNYHILSYYKKFLMMISLPIFYSQLNMQIYALMGIQIFQMIRFLKVWPFQSKVRNLIRLGLQFCLFAFFGSILIQSYMLKEIMLSDPNTLQSAVDLFYKLGWVGFCMVFVFNIGFILIFIYDIIVGCRKTNRQMMDQARKFYDMQRLKTYEQLNEDVPIGLVNKWVKLGNLNDRKYDQLPDLSLRIQYFRILKINKAYQIDVKVIFQLFMNIEFNYSKENNVTAGKKMNKRIILDKTLSPSFFHIIDELFKQYKEKVVDFEYMTIKTFYKVLQSSYKPGQKIQLKREQMEQKIQLETYAGQTKTFKLDKLLDGFPLSYEDLKKFN